MEDSGIIALYWARDEQAVAETDARYGSLCRSISYNILRDRQDAEECVNDTYVQAWNTMPPQRPQSLGAFLSRITRNLSINVYRAKNALRRGGGQIPAVLDELTRCTGDGPEAMMEAAELSRLLDQFLRNLPRRDCAIFLRRYWYAETVEEIAHACGFPIGSVKSSLFRSRRKLKVWLEKEGIYV